MMEIYVEDQFKKWITERCVQEVMAHPGSGHINRPEGINAGTIIMDSNLLHTSELACLTSLTKECYIVEP